MMAQSNLEGSEEDSGSFGCKRSFAIGQAGLSGEDKDDEGEGDEEDKEGDEGDNESGDERDTVDEGRASESRVTFSGNLGIERQSNLRNREPHFRHKRTLFLFKFTLQPNHL
jgi:hypothetical protein